MFEFTAKVCNTDCLFRFMLEDEGIDVKKEGLQIQTWDDECCYQLWLLSCEAKSEQKVKEIIELTKKVIGAVTKTASRMGKPEETVIQAQKEIEKTLNYVKFPNFHSVVKTREINARYEEGLPSGCTEIHNPDGTTSYLFVSY